MQTQDDIHSSPHPDNKNLRNLFDRIYFKSFYRNSASSNKKRNRSLDVLEQSLPEFIAERLSDDLMDALWQARSEAIIRDAVSHVFISPFIVGDILSGSNPRKLEHSKLPLEIIVKLKKRLHSKVEMRLDLTRRAVSHYFFQLIKDKDANAWQQLCGLMLCAPLLGIDSGISSQDFLASIPNDEKCQALLVEHDDFIGVVRAYVAIIMAERICSASALEAGLKQLKEIKDYEFSSVDDLIKFDEFLHKHYLPFKREHLHQISSLKRKLAPYVEAEKYEDFLNARGWHSAQKLPLFLDDIQECLLDECLRFSPARIDARAMLAELERIEPPLRREDRSLIESEIEAIEKGELKPEQAWIIQVIWPVLKGEKDCHALDLDMYEEELGKAFPFSASFTSKLVQGKFTFSKSEEDTTVGTSELEGVAPDAATAVGIDASMPVVELVSDATFAPSENDGDISEYGTEEYADTAEVSDTDETLPHQTTDTSNLAAAYEDQSGQDEDFTEGEAACESSELEVTGSADEPEITIVEQAAAGYEPEASEEQEEDSLEDAAESPDIEAEPELSFDGTAIMADLDEGMAEMQDYEDHEGVFEPFGSNFLRKEDLDDLGNMGALAENAETASDARNQTDKEEPAKRKRVQESAEEQLETVLKELIGYDSIQEQNLTATINSDEVIAGLLEQGDTAGLYWLGVSQGDGCAVPVWLAEMLHIGTNMVARSPDERERFAILLKQAIEMESLDERQTTLLAAALLRPAMIIPMPDMTTALQTLENAASLRSAAHIFKKLKEIVFRDEPISQAILQGQSGKQLAEASLARLRENTTKFLQRMRIAKTQYQPATEARRRMFGPQGELGIPLEKCLAGDFDNLEENIHALRDARTYDDIINRNRARKTNTKNIEAGAREGLRSDIATCRELLEEWRDFINNETRNDVNSREASWYHDTFFNVNVEELSDTPERRFLKNQIEILRNGLSASEATGPLTGLRLWPLRLPISAPDQARVFESAPLMLAVSENYQNDIERVAASLVLHAVRGNYLLVREFLEVWPKTGGLTPSLSLLEIPNSDFGKRVSFNVVDAVKCAETIWEREIKINLDKLENRIVDSYFRGAININQQNEANLKLHDINVAWKETRNALEAKKNLASLEEQLLRWDEAMLEEVLQRLDGLKDTPNATDEVIEFLNDVAFETREDKSYSVAHDNIARMEAWLNDTSRPFPRRSADMPSQVGAGKEFYELLAQDAIEPLEAEGDLWREGARLANKLLKGEIVGRVTSLLRWLGFDLERNEQINMHYSDGRPQYWKVFSYKMNIRSPLPNWGSRANGRQTIAMGWNSPSPADIDKLMQSGRFRHNDAVTLIVFGSLSYADRLKIMKMSSEWRPFPLIIDTNAFYFLAKQPEEQRRQRLFEICLAGAPLNPYTPDARGDVPKEMFFGRKKIMDSLRDPTGACVIYGGRQLGKSALLLQIANEPQNIDQHLVLRRSIPEEASSLLDVAINCCIKAGVVHPNTTRKTFSDKLRDWMFADESRELLLLLDECDNVLEIDKKRKFAEVKTLRDLMQDTKSRFKVVFTGLHSVQRFSHEPNSPFYQLESICIGPMDTDAAYQLMTEPLALLGINFESQKLIRMALNYCSYQPKLIQMFCHELLEAVKNIPDRGPSCTIDRNSMLRVYASPRLREKIRDSFTMALALDKRYFVIGYVMALNSPNAMSDRELLAELRDYWPAAFNAENCDTNSLKTLLQEMEGLGLLISLEGGWRVRTPNIIELLGGRENIIDELVQYEDLPYDQPGNPDDLRMKDANIFTASQYNLLADKSSRMQWISGWQALGLDRVPDALRAIAASHKDASSRLACIKISGKNKDELMSSLRREYGKINEGGLLAWVSSSEFPNNIVDFMQAASAWLEALRTDKKYVKIICLISPRDFFRFNAKGYATSLSSQEIQLQPWSVPGMESYFLEKDLPANRTAEIMEATNGWPALVENLIQTEDLKATHIKEVVNTESVKEEAARMLQDIPKAANVVATIAEIMGNDKIAAQDLAALRPDDMDESTFDNVISFLLTMHLLREVRGGYQLDPLAFPAMAVS